jgi:ribokinase
MNKEQPMNKILVSGLINIETTARVEDFPITYTPVRYPFWGVNSTVSGVGYNVAKALTTLGDDVRLLSLIGEDNLSTLIQQALSEDHIPTTHILSTLAQTPQSVILYDKKGQRAINVDLKDIQERTYPTEQFKQALQECVMAVLCNINFSRSLLAITQAHGVPIATDVHTISDLDDDYNRDFMAAADLLFMSDEHLPIPPEEWAHQVMRRYGPEVLVIGLGGYGALLLVHQEGEIRHVPPVHTREVVNTVGAGDALFSAFVHFYAKTHNPHIAIEKAMVFASYKIGEKGAASGFLTEPELNEWHAKIKA